MNMLFTEKLVALLLLPGNNESLNSLAQYAKHEQLVAMDTAE